LDSTNGASIMALIRELNAAGATIIMITHDAALADQLPRQIRVLDGQVVSDSALGAHGVLVTPMDGAGGEGGGAMSAQGGRLCQSHAESCRPTDFGLRTSDRGLGLGLKDQLRVASVGLRARPLR